MEDTSFFTELLKIQADLPTFLASLQEIKSAYEEWADGLGAEVEHVLAAGPLTGLKAMLDDLREQVQTFSEDSLASAQNSQALVESLAERQEAMEEATSDRRRARAKADAQSRIDNETSAEESLAATRRNLILTDDAVRQQATAKRIQDEEQLAAKQQQDLERLASLEDDLALKRRGAILREDQQRQEAAAARVLEAERLAEKRQADADKLTERQRVSDEERATRQRRLAEEIAVEQQGLIDTFNSRPTFFEEALSDLGNMALKTVEVYAIWQAINAVVESISTIIRAPFEIYAGGSRYLDEVQASADRLTGTLTSNVKLSDDMSQNFAKASQVAKDATIALRDIAAGSGLSYEHLVTTFQALVTAGVAYHVNNTREIVTLAQILDITNEQVKGNANLRGLLTDIPKLLNGTLQPGSAFLEVTKLTVEQAKELVANAKEHHDLLPQLSELLAPYVDAARQAGDHHERIVAALEEQKKRLEALLALPAYEHVTAILRDILDWLNQHRAAVQAVADILGQATGQLIAFGTHLVGSSDAASSLKSYFVDIVISTAQWIGMLELAAKTINDIGRIWDDDGGLFGGSKDPKQTTADMRALEDDVKSFQKIGESLEKQRQDLLKLLNTRAFSYNFVGPLADGELRSDAPSSSLDNPVDGLGNHPSVDRAPKERPDIRGEYEKQLALIKDYYNRYRDAIKEGEADLAVSKREAAGEIAKLNDREIAEIVSAGTKYRDELKKFYNGQIADNKATPKDRDNALAAFDSTQIKAVSALMRATDAAVIDGRKERTRVLEIESKNELELIKQQAQAELAVESDKYAQGYQTQLEYLANKELIEGRAYAAELDALNKQIEATGLGTERRSQLQAQALLLDQRYTDQVDRNALARIAAIEKENQAVRVHAINMRDAALELQNTSNEIENTLNPPATVDLRSFGIKDQELAAKQREIDIELNLARTKLDTARATDKQTDATRSQIAASTDLIRKLEEERAALTNDRLKNLQGQLQSIQSSTLPGGIKDLYNRAAIQTTRDDIVRTTDFSKLSPQEMDQVNESLRVLRDALADATPNIARSLDQLQKKIFGFDLGQALSKATTSAEKFGVGLEAAANALENISNIVNNVEKASLQGGVAGGIGAGLKEGSGILGGLLSSGLLKGVSKSIPIIGEALGGVLEFFGAMFTHTAAKIAEDVKKSMQDTVTAFQDGDATLQQTIVALQNQRISAISQLSGKKGGQDQLNQLLPQLDQQITQLQQQQKQTIQTFEEQLTILERHSDTLGTIQQQWDGIVKSVRDYLSAGGDATLATKYLSAELEKIQADTQDQLDQGNQQAIQDAISLNGLLQQRLDLVKNFAKQEFDLINADSLERRQAGSVSRGAQITEAQQQYQQQLDALDQQINLTQQKVDKESQVFSIASNINDLHRQDDALTLKALDQQIQKWLDMKSIIESIRMQDTGIYTSGNPIFGGSVSIGTITVGDLGNTAPADVGRQIGDSVRQAVQDAMRNGQIF